MGPNKTGGTRLQIDLMKLYLFANASATNAAWWLDG
jgi:hypothetical protein